MFKSRACGTSTVMAVRHQPLKFGACARPSQQFRHSWKYVFNTACAACAGRTARKSMSWQAWRMAASAFASVRFSFGRIQRRPGAVPELPCLQATITHRRPHRPACPLDLCHQVPAESVHRRHADPHGGGPARGLHGLRGRVEAVQRRTGPRPPTRAVPAEGLALQAGQQPQGRLLPTPVPEVRRACAPLPVVRPPLVRLLLRRIPRRGTAGRRQAVHREPTVPRRLRKTVQSHAPARVGAALGWPSPRRRRGAGKNAVTSRKRR